ncbi:MAG: hypothetical protein ABIT76_00060 [Chthoniobacterales bacterium]
MNPKIALTGCAAALLLAASITTATATNFSTTTVGVMNTNGKPLKEATGNTVNATTFASDIATAYTANTGGVWNFDNVGGFSVNNGETVTVNNGGTLLNTFTYTEGAGAGGINQGNIGSEATSGAFELGLAGNGATRTFTPSTPLIELGIFSLDRNDASRIPVLTVYFQNAPTVAVSTSGATADDVYFHGFKTTISNPIVKFELSQNNFIRYDDLGFVTAVPEPSTVFGAVGLVGLIGYNQRKRLPFTRAARTARE